MSLVRHLACIDLASLLSESSQTPQAPMRHFLDVFRSFVVSPRQIILALSAIIAVLGISSNATAIEPTSPVIAVVKLKTGPFVSGIIDLKTNTTSLTLRSEASGIQLQASYDWSDILAAKIGETVYGVEELKTVAAKMKSAGKSFQEIAPAKSTLMTESNVIASQPAASVFDNRVQALSVHAELANWDADPECDGLRVFVVPCNSQGQLVPVDGEITLTLTGQFQAVATTHERRVTEGFREIADARHLVRKADFARGPAVYTIPFDRYYPEKEFNLVPLGILTARLGVNTQGAFTASEADVVLRYPTYLRDQLQNITDRRTLPIER
jgi:hypothetical protein